jgi:hypothetical protein
MYVKFVVKFWRFKREKKLIRVIYASNGRDQTIYLSSQIDVIFKIIIRFEIDISLLNFDQIVILKVASTLKYKKKRKKEEEE